MPARVFSAAVWGVDAYPVEVEVNASPDKAVTVVDGLPDSAVRESCHRVINAVTLCWRMPGSKRHRPRSHGTSIHGRSPDQGG